MTVEESILGKKKPTVVVPFHIIFGAVDTHGDTIISEEVYDILVRLRDRGYYILVDSHIDLLKTCEALSSSGIPFDGVTYDQYHGMMHDEERYAHRIDYHCGWESVAVVIDEDILRLKVAVELGATAIHIQSGCVIGQRASGKEKVADTTRKSRFTAAPVGNYV